MVKAGYTADTEAERLAVMVFRTEHGEYAEKERLVKTPKELFTYISDLLKEGNYLIDLTVHRKKKAK